jgi:hypothetical protein
MDCLVRRGPASLAWTPAYRAHAQPHVHDVLDSIFQAGNELAEANIADG